ncbi:MAG TPA: SAM-dependent methyltransferase [Thermoanaerobaculia bacterium]|nr:SAM-dependent methyltransferase [Thermoanaerobaculia bacterium]
MAAPPVGNISDTARWVAMYRALESERSDAHFRDPYARELAGEQGLRILDAMPGGRSSSFAFVVRTCLMDELILRCIAQGADTVVNLAAGLDARPYRMELPGNLRWIEVDLPGILDHKESKLAAAKPVCRLERVRLDLSDVAARRELFARIGASSRSVVTVTEGLLVYLTREEAGALASDLHANAGFRWWIIDIASPDLLRWMQKRYQPSLTAAGAPLKFAPEEGTDFYRPLGWKTFEFRSTFEESRRLRRAPGWAWMAGLIGFFSRRQREKLHRMGGVVLLERA